MLNQQLIEQIVKEVMASMGGGAPAIPAERPNSVTKARSKVKVTNRDYPLAKNRPELIKTPTGKGLEEITLQGVLDGEVKVEDVRISPDTLEMQAQVAESMGRAPLAKNLRRAAELISVPDERILEIYNALRPYRSTKEELLSIADELEQNYQAIINAGLVREAAQIYEIRDRLKKE